MFFENLDTPIGSLCIEANETDIVAIRFRSCDERPNILTASCCKQLKEYFSGLRREFDLPLALEGTNFQRRVWLSLLRIRFAETRSYTQLAEMIGNPRAQRAVGGANHLNKLPILVPCHRVIGKDGKLVGYAGGLDIKSWLLAHEKANECLKETPL